MLTIHEVGLGYVNWLFDTGMASSHSNICFSSRNKAVAVVGTTNSCFSCQPSLDLLQQIWLV